jgi:hypothetical protein
MRTPFVSLVAAIISLSLAGCSTTTKPLVPLSQDQMAGYILVPASTSLIRVGQIVDDKFNFVQAEPSPYWDSNPGTSAESIAVNTANAGQLRAFLDLAGVDMSKQPASKINLAANTLSGESLSMVFTDADVTQLVVEEVNKFPRAAFIRRDYGQLAEALDPKGRIYLVSTVVSAREFKLATSVSKEKGLILNTLFGINVDWSGATSAHIKAAANGKTVVAVKFASKALLMSKASDKEMPRIVTDLSQLLGGESRVQFGLKNHGLHNVGPYEGSAVAELFEKREGNVRNLTLTVSGQIVNPRVGSPAVGGFPKILRTYPAHYVMQIEPSSAKEFRRENVSTGGFAGLFIDGTATSSDLVSNVHITNPNDGASFFVFKPVKVVIYTD